MKKFEVQFIKDHPSGIREGKKLKFSKPLAEKHIESGYAKPLEEIPKDEEKTNMPVYDKMPMKTLQEMCNKNAKLYPKNEWKHLKKKIDLVEYIKSKQ